MVRIVVGVIAGFIAWLIVWVGSEKILSAIWPESYGAHQSAFEAALINGGTFSADTTLLVIQIVLGSMASVISGYLAAVIAGDNRRAPLFLGVLLVILGVLKAVLSWRYVPVWHHVVFVAILFPMTMMGGKMRATP